MKNRAVALAGEVIAIFLFPMLLWSSTLNNNILQECEPDSSGSDSYYVWLDIYEPGGPVYSWIDIVGIGTKVEGLTDDNNAGPFPIGFNFPYYYHGYYGYQFWVNSNGAISFSDGQEYVPQGSSGFFIPSTNAPNDLLIPLGADLTFETDSGECYYYSNNIDTLIVSYIDVPAWNIGGPTGAHTFQLILTRQDSCIYFQYSRQEGQFHNNGACAGIENVVGNIGIQILLYTMPDSGYAIKFIPIDTAGVSEDKKSKTRDIKLLCHPNPFTTAAKIKLVGVRENTKSDLSIYDSAGRLVKTVKLATSTYKLGTDLKAGIYFLKLNGKPVGKVVKVR